MKHPSQFKLAQSKPSQDEIPDWFLHCIAQGHLTDKWFDDDAKVIRYECATCNKSK